MDQEKETYAIKESDFGGGTTNELSSNNNVLCVCVYIYLDFILLCSFLVPAGMSQILSSLLLRTFRTQTENDTLLHGSVCVCGF